MSDFQNTYIRLSSFEGASLDGANFAGARFTKCSKWPADFSPEESGAVLVDDDPEYDLKVKEQHRLNEVTESL